jgi:hypothetical protein
VATTETRCGAYFLPTTGISSDDDISPVRGDGSKHIPNIKLLSVSLEEFEIFLAKRARTMVLLLVFNITPQSNPLRMTHRECSTTPSCHAKRLKPRGLMDPS